MFQIDSEESKLKKLLKSITFLFKEEKFAQIVECSSVISHASLLSTPSGVLILNCKARCLYHMSKQQQFSDMRKLRQAFSTWQNLYDNHFPPELTDSFDELWDTAERLDAGQQVGNVDRLCSQIGKGRYINYF
jgi:hypothetical protein